MSTISRFTPPPTVDFDTERFAESCAELADATSDFGADLVIGIATGGAYVARELHPLLGGSPELEIISLSRPATGVKQRVGVGSVLRHLPRQWNNRLRWLEVEAREGMLRRRTDEGGTAPPAHSSLVDRLRSLPGAERVLIVDDTVDSGRTLNEAVSIVAHAHSQAEVRTAVLTSTFRRPPVRPDYCLYDRTLIRFPWSFDS